jgi:hypothetical protein
MGALFSWIQRVFWQQEMEIAVLGVIFFFCLCFVAFLAALYNFVGLLHRTPKCWEVDARKRHECKNGFGISDNKK